MSALKYLVSLCIVISLVSCRNMSVGSNILFDSEQWKAQRVQEESDIRVRMIDDLFNQYNRLIDMERADVLDLLGTPDNTFADGETDVSVERLDYTLGPIWSGETAILEITFDQDRVISTYASDIDP